MQAQAPAIAPSSRFRNGPLFMVIVAIGVGLAGAGGAVLFRILIRLFQGLYFGGAEGVVEVVEQGFLAEPVDPLEASAGLPWYWKVLVPAAGGIVVGPLVYFFAREAKGHGVPEVMEAVARRGGVIRPRIAGVKILASAVSIGSGGSVGREGPIVQIGSAVGSTIGQLLRVPSRQLRTLVGCGAAAGIAATFNAPIAGAIFAVEVIIGDFAVAQFSPIVISSVVATVASRFLLGNHPAFPVPDYELVSPFELLPYMGIGVIAGLVGLAFVSALYWSEDFFDRLRVPEWCKASIGGLLVGGIAVFLPNVYGVGYSTVIGALTGALPAFMLGVLLIAKILATSITIGSGGSGGVFAPSLFLGAMTGGLFGTFVHQWFPDLTASSGAYALVTMGAVVAATSHAPITAIIILFEMTQSITIIPPLMAACVISTLVATFLRRESIYTMKLVRRGIDIKKTEDPNPLKSLFVRDVLDREPEVIQTSASFQTVLDLIVQSDHTEFFVTDSAGRLSGAISLREVRRILHDQDFLRHVVVAGDLVESRPTLIEDDDLDVAMHILSRSDVQEIGVVAREDARQLIGSVAERDVLHAYNQEIMRRDLAGGLSSTVSALNKVRVVDLGGGYVVREIPAPRRMIGRTLRELDLRSLAGVEVILVRGGGAVRVPAPDDEIAEDESLLVAGPRDAVEGLVDY